MKRARITWTKVAIVGGLAIAVYAIVLLKAQRDDLVWDHWDVVKPGILYRSGQLHPNQLEDAARTHRIKTVICLLAPGREVAQERALVEGLGLNFVNLPMPGDGFGREEQFQQALAVIDDPNKQPVLVHCARGTCRTGAVVAYYRFMRDGWTIEDVAAEMERQVYHEHWLPGYVFQMARSHPFYELNAEEASATPQTANKEEDRRGR